MPDIDYDPDASIPIGRGGDVSMKASTLVAAANGEGGDGGGSGARPALIMSRDAFQDFDGGQSIGISADGTMIVGSFTAPGEVESAFLLGLDGRGFIDMGTLPDGSSVIPNAIDPNGEEVAGTAQNSDGNTHAFLYNINEQQFVDLGILSGATHQGNFSQGHDVSQGVVVGGAGDDDNVQQPFWFDGTTMQPLPLPDGMIGGVAFAISFDASKIVGSVFDGTNSYPATWTGDGYTTVAVMALPDGYFQGELFDISSDGNTVIGYAVKFEEGSPNYPVIAQFTDDIVTVLAQPPGVTWSQANAISSGTALLLLVTRFDGLTYLYDGTAYTLLPAPAQSPFGGDPPFFSGFAVSSNGDTPIAVVGMGSDGKTTFPAMWTQAGGTVSLGQPPGGLTIITDGSTTINPARGLRIGSGLVLLDNGGGLAILSNPEHLPGFVGAAAVDAPNDNDTGPYISVLSANPNDYSGLPSNVAIAIGVLGFGYLSMVAPTGDGDGGNVRGSGAIDLQIWGVGKNSAAEVASGFVSAILGGANNTADGNFAVVLAGQGNHAQGTNSIAGGYSSFALSNYSIALGSDNQAGGVDNTDGDGGPNATAIGGFGNLANTNFGDTATIVGGQNNNADGYCAVIVGGTGNIVNADFGEASGGGAQTNGVMGRRVRSIVGAARQQIEHQLVVQTTDDTPTEMSANGGAVSNAAGSNSAQYNVCRLVPNSMMSVEGRVTALSTDGANLQVWTFDVTATQGTDASTTAIVLGSGSPTPGATVGIVVGWGVDIEANTDLGSISFTVTGAADTDINWLCTLEGHEMVWE